MEKEIQQYKFEFKYYTGTPLISNLSMLEIQVCVCERGTIHSIFQNIILFKLIENRFILKQHVFVLCKDTQYLHENKFTITPHLCI